MNEESTNDKSAKADNLERDLAALNLAPHSDDYLDKGLTQIRAQFNEHKIEQTTKQQLAAFWQGRLPFALTAALVLSVSANVFQLTWNKQRINTLEAEQLGQCDVPVARFESSPDSTNNAMANQFQDFKMSQDKIQTMGMC